MKKVLFGGLLTLAALIVSCNKTEGPGSVEGGDATVVVRIADNSSRANPSTVLDEEQMQKGENALRSFTAYVFNHATGRLEAKAEGDLETNSAVLTGLNSATAKRVVVTANTGVADIAVGGNYSEFESMLLDLDDEPISYPLVTAQDGKGFAMFGQKAPVSLNEGDNTTTIEIERLVSKVILSKISLDVKTDPATAGDHPVFSQTDIDNFMITGVSMQKVIGQAGFLGHNSGVLYGGLIGEGIASTGQRSYLIDRGWTTEIANGEGKEFGNFFYVLPNDGSDAHYTMMSVVAKYYDETVYFPVIINKGKVNDKTVGEIVNNTVYTLDLTIHDLLGSPGPEIPKGEASLEVTVSVKNWEFAPLQEEEW